MTWGERFGKGTNTALITNSRTSEQVKTQDVSKSKIRVFFFFFLTFIIQIFFYFYFFHLFLLAGGQLLYNILVVFAIH